MVDKCFFLGVEQRGNVKYRYVNCWWQVQWKHSAKKLQICLGPKAFFHQRPGFCTTLFRCSNSASGWCFVPGTPILTLMKTGFLYNTFSDNSVLPNNIHYRLVVNSVLSIDTVSRLSIAMAGSSMQESRQTNRPILESCQISDAVLHYYSAVHRHIILMCTALVTSDEEGRKREVQLWPNFRGMSRNLPYVQRPRVVSW